MTDTSLMFRFLGTASHALRATGALGDGFAIVPDRAEEAIRKASGEVDKGAARWKRGFAAVGALAGTALATAAAIGIRGVYQQGQDRALIQAQLGITPKEAGDLGKAGGKAYARGFGDSAGANMQVARTAIQSGLVALGDTTAVGDAIVAAQTLAKTYEVDVSDSVRAAAQLVKTGLAKDSKEAFDLLYVTLRNTGDMAGDLTDTVAEYSTKFRDLGFTGAQSLGLLQQASLAGARDLDVVADAMKELQLRVQDGSVKAAGGFKMLGLDAKNLSTQMALGGQSAAAATDLMLDRLRGIKDPVQQNAAALALFATKFEDLGKATFALDPSAAISDMGDVTGAVQQAADTLSAARPASERFQASLQVGLTNAMSAALPLMDGITTQMGKHNQVVKTAVPILLGAAAAVAAVSAATRVWAAVETTMVGVKGVATAAQWAWNAALWGFPLVWIVAAVLAVIGVIVLIATKTTWFQTAWKFAWGGIKTAAHAVASWFTGTLVPAVTGAWDRITGAVSAVLGWFQALPGRVVGFLQALPGLLWSLFSNAMTMAAYAIGSGLGWLLAQFLAAPMRIWTALQTLGGLLWGAFTWAMGLARDAAVAGIGWLWQQFLAAPGRLLAAVQALPGMLSGWASSAWRFALNATVAGVGWVINQARQLPGRIVGALSSLGSMLWNAGVSAFQGLVNGIQSLAGRLQSLARDMARKFLDGFKKQLGIASPSRVMVELARTGIGAGLVRGLDQAAAPVQTAGGRLAYAAATGAANIRTTPGRGTVAGPAAATRNDLVLRGEREVVEFVRRLVRSYGGGNVQTAFGSSR
jgi:hypothetical protein